MPRQRLHDRERGLDQRRGRDAHRHSHPSPREKSRLKSIAVVASQIAAENRFGSELGEPHRAVESSRGQRRDCAGRIADNETAIAGNAAKNAIDRNQSAAPLDDTSIRNVRDAPAKLHERSRWIESRPISGDAHMHMLAVARDPRDVAGRETRVEKAVQRGRAGRGGDDLLESDEKLRIAIQS